MIIFHSIVFVGYLSYTVHLGYWISWSGLRVVSELTGVIFSTQLMSNDLEDIQESTFMSLI